MSSAEERLARLETKQEMLLEEMHDCTTLLKQVVAEQARWKTVTGTVIALVSIFWGALLAFWKFVIPIITGSPTH